MKRKVCRKCKVFVDTTQSPINGCTHQETTTTYLGRIIILDTAQSQIAKNVNLNVAGEYAIKTR